MLATIALSVTTAGACMLVLIAAAWLVHPPTHLPGAYASLGDQNQSVKSALYLVTFVVVAPLSVIFVPRVLDVIRHGPNGWAVPPLAAGLACALTVLIIIARVSAPLPWGDGAGPTLVAGLCWWGGAGLLTWRLVGSHRLAWRRSAERMTTPLALAAVAGALAAVLCVTSIGSLSPVAVALGAIVIAAIFALDRRIQVPQLRGWRGITLDLLAILMLALAIPNLVIFKAGTPIQTLLNLVAIQGQENYLLGPANQVLSGGTMLVDTVSQYGVGSIYFLVGWFHLAPIGYGTLGFLDGVLNAMVFIAGYLILRVAGASRLLSAAAMALGVLALIYNLRYPVGALAEHGPLRFGLPIAAMLTAVAAIRWPQSARAARVATLLVVAVAAIWSLEAFAYTALTLAAVTTVHAATMPSDARRAWLVRGLLQALGAVVLAHLMLAGLTLASTGKLPDWAQYVSYFNAFLFGGLAKLTYGFARWSPGLAVGMLYLASAIGLALTIWRAPARVRAARVSFAAVAGATAYGIGLFSYFDNRSATYLLLYVAFPALLTGTLWLSLLLRLTGPRDPLRRVGLGFGVAVATVACAAAWQPASYRFSQSALAHVIPGGPSMRTALRRLWHPPPINPRAADGVRLLERFMPHQHHVLVLTPSSADLQTEILIRSRRGNTLPIGYAVEDSLVPSARLGLLHRAVTRLRANDRLLLDTAALAFLARLREQPSLDPLRTPDPRTQEPLQQWVLKEISVRFGIRPIYVDRQGLLIAELIPRVTS